MRKEKELMKIGAFKHIKKYGWKQFRKDWSRNFLMLQTPDLITKQRIFGGWGTIFGLSLVAVMFWFRDIKYAIIAVGFGIFLQYINLKQLYAQKLILSDLKEEFVEVGKDE